VFRARVAELADALDLGSSGQPWGFNSPLSHHYITEFSQNSFSPRKERSKNVGINVTVTDLSDNQKKLQVEIPAQTVREEFEKRYRDLAKRVRIKGFRPGKAPRGILKSYYGKSIEHEVSSQFVQDTFPEALRKVDLKPLTEADVEEINFADDGAFTYAAVVDVCPPFELEGYKGLELHRPAIQVSEEEVGTELENIRQEHAQIRTLESDRPVEDGDMVLIDFVPSVSGVVFQKGSRQDQMIEVGKKALHPDFDQHLIGHSLNDTISFELDYPEDAPTREIAGKKVHFEVTIKELKEKVVPELNDELAREVGQFETLDALRQEIRSRLEKRKEEGSSENLNGQIIEQLLPKAQFEISSKVIDREVDRMIGLLRHQFESQGLKIDTSGLDSPAIRAEYRPQAEKNVRWRLVSQQLAAQEDIEVSDDEREDIYRQMARLFRMDVETLKEEYSESQMVQQAVESKVQEKVFKFVKDNAMYKDAPIEEQEKPQE
jgi:trigger factor